jgi:hypothetical protein
MNKMWPALVFLVVAPLAAQSITVTSPAAGAQWCQGSGYAITWTSTGVSGPVAIKLRLANAPDAPPVLDIVASMGNTGTYTWPVPASVPAGAYVIRVRTVADSPLVYDDSDAFLIKACQPPAGTITVTAPAPGAEWCQGSSYAITWMSSDVAGPMSIKLYQAGVPNAPPVLDIVANTGNAGTYTWPVPASVPAGAYLVRVRPVSESMVYDDSDAFMIITCGAAPVVSHLPAEPLPSVILKFPRLEVSGIGVAPNAGGFAIIFNYKNAGNAPLPKAAEVPVKPDYRVQLDGQETARGSLFIPAFPAEPGWEQWGYNGGQMDLPTWKSYTMDGLPLHDKYFYMMQWHVGDRVTVHVNENKVMGMNSHELAKDLRPMLMEHYYDLGIGAVTYDWPSHTLSVSVRLAGKIPLNRSFNLVCVNQYLPSHVWSVVQALNRRDFSFSEKVAVPDGVNEASFEVFILLDRMGDQRIDDIDMRNNYLLVKSQRAQ